MSPKNVVDINFYQITFTLTKNNFDHDDGIFH